MKIVVIFPHIGFFRHAESIVRQLCQEGHKVKLLFGELHKDKPGVTDRGVQIFLKEFPQCSSGKLIERVGLWSKVTYFIRQLNNYRIYLNPRHANPDMRLRWKPHFRGLAWKLISSRMGERLLATRAAESFLKQVEKSILPDGGVSLELMNEQPDVVLDMTNLVFNAADIEYQKAACALNIPLIMAVASWDNLTTKGTFQFLPDLVCVWNQDIADEAIHLHHIPQERIVITGAPVFDYLFAARPVMDRQAFCLQAGLDFTRRDVLYLCSSVQVAGDETSFLRDFADNLRNNPATRDTIIMVRPYPMNGSIWKGFQAENVVVWPPEGELTDIAATQQNFFHSIFYSQVVVGVNTTAMIEAAVVDKPCVTILTERYQATQTGRGHFHHLLKADFLEVAHGFGESTEVIERILAGGDIKAGNRCKFVHEFVRPRGLDRSVASLFVRLAVQAGRHEGFRKPS
jgi:hypothetical protein